MKYREYFGIVGLSFGKWKIIPDIQYVTVFIEAESGNSVLCSMLMIFFSSVFWLHEENIVNTIIEVFILM